MWAKFDRHYDYGLYSSANDTVSNFLQFHEISLNGKCSLYLDVVVPQYVVEPKLETYQFFGKEYSAQ